MHLVFWLVCLFVFVCVFCVCVLFVCLFVCFFFVLFFCCCCFFAVFLLYFFSFFSIARMARNVSTSEKAYKNLNLGGNIPGVDLYHIMEELK